LKKILTGFYSLLLDLTKFAAINLGNNFEKINNVNSTEEVPEVFNLANAFPNPFNPTTLIRYELPNDETVQLKIYDIIGNEVYTLVNEYQNKGRYSVSFDASSLASGIYIYRLQAGNFVSSKKMTLIK
jgi:hypothetical protein